MRGRVDAAWILVLVLLVGCGGGKDKAAPGRPDVLLLCVDDLNNWLGCLEGHPDARTPNIDALARRGVLFERAYCTAPACNPSRASVLSGLHPTTSGVYVNKQDFRLAHPERVTLPELFKKQGYEVLGAGKIEHTGSPDRDSWDDYFPSWDRNVSESAKAPASHAPVFGERPDLDWAELDVEDPAMGDWKTVEWARGKIAEPRDRPLFLAVGLYQCHLPWYLPRSWMEKFEARSLRLPVVRDDDLRDVPLAGRKLIDGLHRRVLRKRQWRRLIRAYLSAIAFVDDQVGRLMEALDASPRRDDTYVVLWSDHGFQLGHKGSWKKFALWEQALQVPLVVAGPGIEPGTRDQPVSLLDLYPTLTELCDLPVDQPLDGHSLVPVLEDPGRDRGRPVLSTYRPGNHSVRSRRWRYIRYEDGSEELYDHEVDRWEFDNVAAKPELAEVKKGLAAAIPRTESPYRPPPEEDQR